HRDTEVTQRKPEPGSVGGPLSGLLGAFSVSLCLGGVPANTPSLQLAFTPFRGPVMVLRPCLGKDPAPACYFPRTNLPNCLPRFMEEPARCPLLKNGCQPARSPGCFWEPGASSGHAQVAAPHGPFVVVVCF